MIKKQAAALIIAAAMMVGVLPSVYAQTTASISSPTGSAQSDGRITIYFTNDVHCAYEKYDQVATAIRDKDLLVDAGDNIQGDLIGTLSDGGYMVDIMNYMDYDVAVPGNHEFDYGMDRFLEIARGSDKLAEYDYLSCNLREIASGKTLLDGYKIYEVEGEKVGIVGITTPETLVKSNPAYFKNAAGEWIYDLSNDSTGEALYAAVQAAVDGACEEGADYVIAVGHLGMDDESKPWTSAEVIANTEGIDALIDGHSHSTFNTVAKNKNNEDVITIQTGTKLENLGRLTIEDGQFKAELIPITENAPAKDGTTGQFLAGMTDKFEEIKNKKVAKTEVDLTTVDPKSGDRMIRNLETNLGDLCADAYRAKLGADIAFVNGGGIRADIKKGDITFGDIVAVHPYGNEVCMIEVTGQQILDALEWASRSTPDECGGFLQVSGLSYEVDTNIPSPCKEDAAGGFASIDEGERRVKNVKVGVEAIAADKTYKLGGHNYMLFDCGDGFNMFKGAKKLAEGVAIDNQVLIDYITDTLGGAVSAESIYKNPYGEGRIKVITAKDDIEITGCTYDESAKKLKAEFNVSKAEESSDAVIAVIYAENGTLAAVVIIENTFDTVGSDTVEIDLPGVLAGKYSYTLMVCDGLSDMTPKAKPLTVNN